jgi:hypothetical protein
MKIIGYIFYWVFKRQNTKYDTLTSIGMGSMAITLLLMFNIGVLEGLISKFFKTNLTIFFIDEKSYLFFLLLYIAIIIYFKQGNRYQQECKKIEQFNFVTIRKLKTLSIVYIITSILLAFIIPTI